MKVLCRNPFYGERKNKNRIKAIDIIKKNNWKVGTRIVADSWTSGPAVIMSIDQMSIVLLLKHKGSSKLREVKTLPIDVREVI